MTAQQLRLIGENARQLPLVAEPVHADMSDFRCPWCDRLGCTGQPDCRYISPYEQEPNN